MTSLAGLIDATVRCTRCNAAKGQCDCWKKCAVCGWRYYKTETCQNQEEAEHMEVERRQFMCVCEKKFMPGRVCADARPVALRNPCRCACHLKKFRRLQP